MVSSFAVHQSYAVNAKEIGLNLKNKVTCFLLIRTSLHNPCKHIQLGYDYDSYGTQREVEKLKNYCSSGYFYNLPSQ